MQNEKDFLERLKSPKTQQEAFRELVREHKKQLYYQIRNIVLNHDDADDVLQNTFIKIFQNIGSFKGDSKLSSWMYRIATNEAITFINNRAKKSGISSEELKDKMINNLQADVDYDGDEMAFKLQNAVNTLPEKQQLVFKMKYYQEMKYEEMAEVLQTSVGALKASYFHAVKKIEDFINTH